MITSLRGCDTIVFTGGVGENSAEIRAAICDRLEWVGIRQGGVLVRVIPTNEELLIAQRVLTLLRETSCIGYFLFSVELCPG